MAEAYNLFFYANVCHICKCFGRGHFVRRCSDCKMISYCGKEHQKQHWPQHRSLCKAICNVYSNNKFLQLFHKTQEINMKVWAQMKMNLMLLVGIQLGRQLELYEQQIFKFPRACTICHEQNVDTLEDCPSCPSASFCTEHNIDSSHKETCPHLKLCFDLDVGSLDLRHQIPAIHVPCQNFEKALPENMSTFIEYYVRSNNSNMPLMQRVACDSEYLTRPLTLLYAIQALRNFSGCNNIIVHVVAANLIDISGLELWEILLHWLPFLTSLKIVFIGPELNSSSISPTICNVCEVKGKKLFIEIHDELYEEYCYSDWFVSPDLVIGYNAGIHECEEPESPRDTWAVSLRFIAKQNCPFILTAYTLEEGEREQERLIVILRRETKCIYYVQNPYASLRPYRDYETEKVYYQNNYTIIYRSLNA